jgi:hypothetical protein
MACIRESPSEEPSRDAAELVAALTDGLRTEHSDVTTFDFKYLLGISPGALVPNGTFCD